MLPVKPLIGLTAGDLESLQPGRPMDSMVISAFLRLVERRSAFYSLTYPRVCALEPTFLENWRAGGWDAVRSYAGERLNEQHLLLFPMCLLRNDQETAWTLIVVRPHSREIQAYDPLRRSLTIEMLQIQRFLHALAIAERRAFNAAEWKKLDTPDLTPELPDSEYESSGVLVCWIADLLAQDASVVKGDVTTIRRGIDRALRQGRFGREEFSTGVEPATAPAPTATPALEGMEEGDTATHDPLLAQLDEAIRSPGLQEASTATTQPSRPLLPTTEAPSLGVDRPPTPCLSVCVSDAEATGWYGGASAAPESPNAVSTILSPYRGVATTPPLSTPTSPLPFLFRSTTPPLPPQLPPAPPLPPAFSAHPTPVSAMPPPFTSFYPPSPYMMMMMPPPPFSSAAPPTTNPPSSLPTTASSGYQPPREHVSPLLRVNALTVTASGDQARRMVSVASTSTSEDNPDPRRVSDPREKPVSRRRDYGENEPRSRKNDRRREPEHRHRRPESSRDRQQERHRRPETPRHRQQEASHRRSPRPRTEDRCPPSELQRRQDRSQRRPEQPRQHRGDDQRSRRPHQNSATGRVVKPSAANPIVNQTAPATVTSASTQTSVKDRLTLPNPKTSRVDKKTTRLPRNTTALRTAKNNSVEVADERKNRPRRALKAIGVEEETVDPWGSLTIPQVVINRLRALHDSLTPAQRHNKRWRVFLEDDTFIRLRPNQVQRLLDQRR